MFQIVDMLLHFVAKALQRPKLECLRGYKLIAAA